MVVRASSRDTVDLPEPLSPTTAVTVPARSSSEMPSAACTIRRPAEPGGPDLVLLRQITRFQDRLGSCAYSVNGRGVTGTRRGQAVVQDAAPTSRPFASTRGAQIWSSTPAARTRSADGTGSRTARAADPAASP